MRLKMSLADVTTLVKFMDTGGDMQIDREELETVIKDFRRFAYEQRNKNMLSAKKLPLTTIYGSLSDIFISSDVINGGFNKKDVGNALRRLRGDVSMPFDPDAEKGVKVLDIEETNMAREVLNTFQSHMDKHNETVRGLFGSVIDANDEISCNLIKQTMLNVKTKPVKKVSERSERALMKTRILAMNPAKWLQT